MKRLRIFAKGNSDLTDPLFGCEDAAGSWGGLNELLRETGRGWRMRLVHETAIRSDALLATTGEVPPALADLPLAAPYDHACQFSARFFTEEADVYALSLQPDLNSRLMHHRASGRLFYPGTLQGDPAQLRGWLRTHCDPVPMSNVDSAIAAMGAVIDRLRQRTAAPVLLFNLSSVVPGDRSFALGEKGEPLPQRMRRFNLAAMELTRRAGVYIIDVDRVLAEAGAARLKLDAIRVNSAGCRLIGGEVLRVLDAIGVTD